MRLVITLALLIVAWTSAWAQETAVQQPNYQLQPGDTIEVSVWQEPKLNRQVLVTPDGLISFPLVGHLRVEGQTVETVEQALKRKLQAKYATELDVTVLLVGTPKSSDSVVYVTGEVNKPGPFQLQGNTNVLQAIAIAGGFGPFASKSRVRIHRQANGQELAFTFNYKDYESGRDVSGNIELQPGDVVVVPERGFFD